MSTNEARGIVRRQEVRCWGVSMHFGAWYFSGVAE